jgi:beta-lactamase regulating signal transducer with metallopeptidase domain
MTALGIQIVWLAVRVALVAMLALVFMAWLVRRNARSTVVVVTGATMIFLAQGIAALVPLPDSCRWSLPVSSPAAERLRVFDLKNSAQQFDVDAEPFAGVAFARVRAWLDQLGESMPQSPAWQRGWGILTVLYGLGVAFAGGRLLAGWLAIRALRRRSAPLTDPDLLRLTDSLREILHCTQPVELRASEEPGMAATVGWWRALVFVPPEWRSWTAAERQAVLAHELAHVRHRDYLIGLLARCCQVLYFYHPLVWWLSAQMRWQQEVAADALAAAAAGGRDGYWKTLARLALRTPARMPTGALGWSAMSGGALLRRIQMLRGTGESRAMNWPARGTIIGLLAGAALLASSLGSPATPPASDAGTANVEPFDLGYLASKSMGFVAVRPALLFKEPGMDVASRKIDVGFGILKNLGISRPAALRPENIDQIVTDVSFGSQGTGKPGSRSLQFGGSSFMIRLNQDFDWLAFFKKLDKEIQNAKGLEFLNPLFRDMKEIHRDGITLYRLGAVPMFGPKPLTCYFPDRRTAIFSSDHKEKPDGQTEDAGDSLLELIRGVPAARQRDWGSGRKPLDRLPFALVLDNTAGHYVKIFAKDVESKDLKVLEAIRFVAFGIELGDGRPVRLIVDAQSAAAVPDLEKAFDGYAELTLKAVRQHDGSDDEELGEMETKLVSELMLSRQVHRRGSSLEWQAFSTVRIHHLLEDALKESKQAENAKSKEK